MQKYVLTDKYGSRAFAAPTIEDAEALAEARRLKLGGPVKLERLGEETHSDEVRYAEELRDATHVVYWEERDEEGEWTPMSCNASSQADAEECATRLHAEGRTNIRIELLPGCLT